MQLLVVATTLVLGAAHVSREEMQEHFVNLDNRFTTMALQAPHPDPMVAQSLLTCVAAYTLFNVTAKGPCKGLFDAFADNTTQAQAQSAVDTYCNTCGTLIADQITDVWRQCEPLNPWTDIERKGVRLFILIAKAACSKYSDGVYCLPRAKALKDLGHGELNETRLTTICHPCNAIWLALYGSFSDDPMVRLQVAYVGLVCTNWGGKFCALETRNVMELPHPDPSLPVPTTYLDSVCEPCVRIFLRRTDWILTRIGTPNPNISAYVHNIHNLCAKKADGTYCLPDIQARKDAFSHIGGNCSTDFAANTCGTGCKTAITSLSNDLGCCFGTALAIMTKDNTAGPTEAQIRLVVGVQCGILLPVSCAAQAVLIALVLRNLAWAYVSAHLDDVRDKIAADFCYLTSSNSDFCTKDLVTITPGATKTGARRLLSDGGSSISFNLNDAAMTSSDMTAHATDIQSQAAAGTIFLPSTEGLGDSAKVDAFAGVSSTPAFASSATAAQAGFGVLLALVALLAL